MPAPLMPADANSQPIQVLTPDPTTVANAAVGGASSALALPADAQIVEIGVTTDCWILFGTSGASVSTSTGQFMPKGAVVYGVPRGATHLAHIQNSASGRISITKLV